MQSAEKPQRLESLLKAGFERSFEAIAIVGDNGQFIEVNPAVCDLFGLAREELINHSIINFLKLDLNCEQAWHLFWERGQEIGEVQLLCPNGTTRAVEYTSVIDLSPGNHLLILRDITKRRQAAKEELQRQHQRVELFSEVTLKIRQSLQLKEILQTAVTEVQRILRADRVLIYQVFANGTGKIISEATLPTYPAILDVEFPEEVFPPEYRELYGQGRTQAYADVHSPDAALAECLVEFLDEWHVKAKLVVPILQSLNSHTNSQNRRVKPQNQLWGLLIAHQCQAARPWSEFEVELMQQLADQIGIALSQAQLLENLEEMVAERTAELRKVNSNLQQEINDRLQAEEALRRSEEQLRLITNALPVLIAYIDKEQRYRFNNQAYKTWLGLSPLEVSGSHLQKVHGKKVYQQIRVHVEAALSGRTVTYEHEMTLKDRRTHSVSVTYIPHLSEEEGLVKGFFALTSDISDRKAIERMKDEFISVVSHELRTPLASIHGSLKILATGKLGKLSAKGQRMLEIADEQTDRLVRLVNNVLDLQRIESGKVNMDKKACNAADLIKKAVQAMQTMATEHGVNLATKSTSFSVWADPDYIVQTLTNLLSNAIKFSPANSTVWLSAITDNEVNRTKKQKQLRCSTTAYVTFQVKDQGQGIPNSQLESIFERFEQVDSSDSRKKGGTGLGLTICRKIIQQHGGRIWAESSLGKGSTFYFTLPALKKQEEDNHEY
ncbi:MULTISPECIES: ATP-binding protein [unclassified Moorena]|uniref:ATP-binding protein n=1 Tax=unclassified Moorena TaxID=2683338 RepID=UPI0013FEEE3F|nr:MULTISPECIES: ATP-binding protein [unclassified Moorena]NEO17053.1 PAS domain S-box protein [Moorena sp. SIO3E8]NEQ03629.1 PAS domain S-box protein [Moorena sp. SIO3F7]